MKINETKILLYTEEKGILEFHVGNFPIHLNSGDSIRIQGNIEFTGIDFLPTVLEGFSASKISALVALRDLVRNFLLGNITRKELKKEIKRTGIFKDDSISTS